jgi:hypothetical protein
MTPELKPCPFCNFQPTLKDYVKRRFFEDPKVYYYVQCNCCGIRTEVCMDEIIAVGKWNRRDGE